MSMEHILRQAYEAFVEERRANGEEVMLSFEQEIDQLFDECLSQDEFHEWPSMQMNYNCRGEYDFD